MQDEFNENRSAQEQKSDKDYRRINIMLALIAAVLLVAVTAMLTFSVTVKHFFPSAYQSDLMSKINVVKSYIDSYAYFDADEDERVEAAVKAYVAVGNDRYSVFYNAEEFKALNEDNEGKFVGIGVSITESEAFYDGKTLKLIEIVNVYEGSPAEEAGICDNDLIYSVHTEQGELFTDEIGYDVAVSQIRGEEGSEVTVTILRPTENGYEKKNFTLVRRPVEIKAVVYEVSEEEPSVGIVSVAQFDMTTPQSMKAAFESFRNEGITKAVIDLRDNGGGDLKSVVACASYFLNRGDIIISAEDNSGARVEYTARSRSYSSYYAPCNVSESDIGCFKDFECVVLVNGNTASAAELLTAVFRDYELAEIVGVNTYGKGTMQTIYPLNGHGINGGLKITTDIYFPPCGENYDGVGIAPDLVVELEDGGADNQLKAAIDLLVK